MVVVRRDAVFWRRYGMGSRRGRNRRRLADVRTSLRERRILGFSRLENVAVLAIIVLMVLRPG